MCTQTTSNKAYNEEYVFEGIEVDLHASDTQEGTGSNPRTNLFRVVRRDSKLAAPTFAEPPEPDADFREPQPLRWPQLYRTSEKEIKATGINPMNAMNRLQAFFKSLAVACIAKK